jgi:hypothetical protein
MPGLDPGIHQECERPGESSAVRLLHPTVHIREGHVTIRHESVNNELLGKVVIADTPGSGDTQFVEEVARDFLPICDVILFFFSATSPLDKTDLPLLTEIHKRLRFIPIRFIVTRADEFRVDPSKPISESNIDTVRRDRFLGDVLTRLNKLLHPTVYTEEQFILIDNKAPRYNIEKIIELIQTKCDPESPSARIVMHGHKLHYFQSTAKELKSFFANFIDDKLRQLSKIVDTAEQNIRLYNDNVLISNNIAPTIDAVRSKLLDSIGGQLRDDVQHLSGRLDIQLSGAAAEGNRQYEADILAAQRRRRFRYATIIGGAGVLVFAAYLFYAFLNRDVAQDRFNSVVWNLVAEAITLFVAAFYAKWSDDFPKTSKRILEDAQVILRGKVLGIVDHELQSHEFSALSDANLSKKLVEAYHEIVNVDPDGWNQMVAERMDSIRRYDVEYRRLRNEYERSMEEVFEHTSSYFSDASKNLERLNEVAARVKARAIEPSFDLLASTRESLNEVKQQIQAIEFSV